MIYVYVQCGFGLFELLSMVVTTPDSVFLSILYKNGHKLSIGYFRMVARSVFLALQCFRLIDIISTADISYADIINSYRMKCTTTNNTLCSASHFPGFARLIISHVYTDNTR